MLAKLELSTRCFCNVLYFSKTALEIGLMKPSTTIGGLALKSCAKTINICKGNTAYQNRCNSRAISIVRKCKIEEGIWSNDAGETLEKNKIEVEDNKNDRCKIICNKLIIDYIINCSKDKNLLMNKLAKSNHTKIFRRMHLSYNLVGMRGESMLKEKQ